MICTFSSSFRNSKKKFNLLTQRKTNITSSIPTAEATKSQSSGQSPNIYSEKTQSFICMEKFHSGNQRLPRTNHRRVLKTLHLQLENVHPFKNVKKNPEVIQLTAASGATFWLPGAINCMFQVLLLLNYWILKKPI